MIFAAGKGTRMWPLVADRPKPMIAVGGKPLIDHALDLTQIPRVTKRVVNLHYKAKPLRDHLVGSGVVFSDESEALLETGGGLRKALPLLGADPVLTLNSDAIWIGPNPVSLLLDHWHAGMEGLLVLLPQSNAHGHSGAGDFSLGPEGKLIRGGPMIYSGAQIICTDRLAAVPDPSFSLNLIWDQMIAAGTLYGVTYPGQWCDVGRPESIALAEGLLKARPHV